MEQPSISNHLIRLILCWKIKGSYQNSVFGLAKSKSESKLARRLTRSANGVVELTKVDFLEG